MKSRDPNEDGKLQRTSSDGNLSNAVQVLRDVNVSINAGSLIGVTGSVGSGKSTFLLSILNETERFTNNGKVIVRGDIAYASQEAWIINATLRENVLFGCEYVTTEPSMLLFRCT